jgi:cytochrome c
MRKSLGLAAAAVVFSFATAAFADGDAAKGQKVFMKCKTCHSLEAGKNMVGPSLHGLFGRKAGTAAGYKYSDALKNANIQWDEDHLENWLKNPKTAFPGNKMVFVGLKKDEDIDNLIAYLKTATK